MQSVLDGIKVLDCSQYGTGPYAALVMGFMGAEVVKLEMPAGDMLRSMSNRYKGISYLFALVNLNKKSITLNLKTEQGKEIFKELIKHYDVVIENFLPGTMESWGLSYDEMKNLNQGLIYASINGFGRGSKYEKVPAFDPIIQAMSGAMASTGFPGSPPVRSQAAFGDFGAGAHLVIAILGALYHRQQTGRGQRIEIAMRDSILYFPFGIYKLYHEEGQVEKEKGNQMVGFAPYNTYRAKDGYVYILGTTDAMARRVMEAIGKEDYITPENFASPQIRWEHQREIDSMVEAWTATKTKREIFEELSRRDVPCGPVMTIDEVWNDEDLLSRRLIMEIDQPGMGKIKVLNSPVKVSPMRGSVAPAPLIGQNNNEIYRELLGFSEEKLRHLRKENVV